MDLQILWDALLALVPPTLVGGLFYVIMRGILRADSTERKVYARMEAEMRAEREAETVQKVPKKSASSAQKVTKSTNKTSL
jgi:GrpB-like predicted nucleotidyltransferase (UPF0157 family)